MAKFRSTRHVCSVVLILTLNPGNQLPADDAASPTQNTIAQPSVIALNDVERALESPCPEIPFEGIHPLSMHLQIVSQHLSAVAERPIPMLIDRVTLEKDNVQSLEDVEIRCVRINAGTHTCCDLLELLFQQTDVLPLTFVPRPGHLLVTTVERAQDWPSLETRIYDVSDLLPHDEPAADVESPPTLSNGQPDDSLPAEPAHQPSLSESPDAEPPATQGGCPMAEPNLTPTTRDKSDSIQTGDEIAETERDPVQALVRLIQEQTDLTGGWSGSHGGVGSISVFGHHLVIRHHWRMHRRIDRLLNDLRQVITEHGAPTATPLPPGYRWHRGGGIFSIPAEQTTDATVSAAQPQSQERATPSVGLTTPLSRSRIVEALELPCPPISIHEGESLDRVLELLSEYLSERTGHPMIFFPDQPVLNVENVPAPGDVTLRELTLSAGTHTCWNVLRLISEQTNEPTIGFLPQGGHVLVTTIDEMHSASHRESRVYVVTDLLESIQTPPFVSLRDPWGKPTIGSRSGLTEGFGLSLKMDLLIELIMDQSAPPAFWYEGRDPGAINVYGQYLIIRHNWITHQTIERLLSDLRNRTKSSKSEDGSGLRKN